MESILVSEIKKTTIFLLTIVTNKSNLFRIESLLRWTRINLFKFFQRVFFKMFCGFNIGCPDNVDVLFKFAEIFDSSEPGNSTCIKLYTDSLTQSSVTSKMFPGPLKFQSYYYQEIIN